MPWALPGNKMNTKIGKFDIGSDDKIAHTLAQPGVEKFHATSSGYSFWLKGIPTEIKIMLSVNGERGGFNFHTSHVIQTPKQLGAYRTSSPWSDNASYALHLAVTTLTQGYGEAINAGLQPDAAWLVPN